MHRIGVLLIWEPRLILDLMPSIPKKLVVGTVDHLKLRTLVAEGHIFDDEIAEEVFYKPKK